mmetsp:Transcript_27529/g.56638  ORF Transcript_27529/g.56638 Transcript_27529/m.56638 type:complete len:382 (+) Transcript_27529:66-1211(+)
MTLKFPAVVLSIVIAGNAIIQCHASIAQTVEYVAASYARSSTIEYNAEQFIDHRPISVLERDQSKLSPTEEIEPDVGLLSSSSPNTNTRWFASGRPNAFFARRKQSNKYRNDNLRFLQDGNSTSNCPDTCDPNLCACVDEYGNGYECSEELHAVCTNATTTLADCVKPSYLAYYSNIYCPFAACIVDGGAYNGCACDFYTRFCDIYGSDEVYSSESKTILYCAVAACCAARTDDAGKGECLLEAPTGALSGMPIGPTVSPVPTVLPTTVTYVPTLVATTDENLSSPAIIDDNGNSSPAPNKLSSPDPPDSRGSPTPRSPDTPENQSPPSPSLTFAPTGDDPGTTDAVEEAINDAMLSWRYAGAAPTVVILSAMTLALLFNN